MSFKAAHRHLPNTLRFFIQIYFPFPSTDDKRSTLSNSDFSLLNSNKLISLHVSVRSTQITTTLEGDWRLRRSGSTANSTTNSPSRFPNNSKSNLNRRSLHHQSNGSLHSADSQSSTSPAQSPLPRPATVHSTAPLQLNNNTNGLQSQSSASNLLNQSGTNSPTGLGKRWNSTGDFVTSPTNQQSPTTLQSSRFATKSLLNLQSKNGINGLLKHG